MLRQNYTLSCSVSSAFLLALLQQRAEIQLNLTSGCASPLCGNAANVTLERFPIICVPSVS